MIAGSRYVPQAIVLNTPNWRFEAQWLSSLPADIGVRTVAYDAVTGALLTAWIEAPLLAQTQATPVELVSYLVGLHSRLPKTARRYGLAARVDVWLAQWQLKGVRGHAVARAVVLLACVEGHYWVLQAKQQDLSEARDEVEHRLGPNDADRLMRLL